MKFLALLVLGATGEVCTSAQYGTMLQAYTGALQSMASQLSSLSTAEGYQRISSTINAGQYPCEPCVAIDFTARQAMHTPGACRESRSCTAFSLYLNWALDRCSRVTGEPVAYQFGALSSKVDASHVCTQAQYRALLDAYATAPGTSYDEVAVAINASQYPCEPCLRRYMSEQEDCGASPSMECLSNSIDRSLSYTTCMLVSGIYAPPTFGSMQEQSGSSSMMIAMAFLISAMFAL